MNSFDQYTQTESGDNHSTIKSYDCLGMLRGITTDSIQNLGYSFDENTGNLISRKDNINNLTEIFSYDNLGRLTDVSGPVPLSTSFANNGNITNKTSVGDYTYGTKPHAVTEVTNPDDLISSTDQRLTYTSYNKVDSIIEGNYVYTLAYGFDDQRTMSKIFKNDTLQKTVYYVGNYEKEEILGTYPGNIYYIYGGDGLAAIYTQQYSDSIMYYVHKDHLGSIDKITNSADTVVQSSSFDAWGRKRNPTNWTYNNIPTTSFSRGYTGHEHLDLFGLINMNGRMYDPILGRFLSSDPFIANAGFTQDYNRYSYVTNNPLRFTDPTGYIKYETPKVEINSDFGSGLFGGSLITNNSGINRQINTILNDRESVFTDYSNAKAQGFTGNFDLYSWAGSNGFTFELFDIYRVSEVDKNGNWILNDDNIIHFEWRITKIDPNISAASGQGDDQSWILGPRGADWGSSMENIAAWGREMDDHFKYGKPGSERRKTGQPPRIVKIIISPIVSIPNSASMLFTGSDIYGNEVNNAQRTFSLITLATPFLPASTLNSIGLSEESLWILEPLIHESLK